MGNVCKKKISKLESSIEIVKKNEEIEKKSDETLNDEYYDIDLSDKNTLDDTYFDIDLTKQENVISINPEKVIGYIYYTKKYNILHENNLFSVNRLIKEIFIPSMHICFNHEIDGAVSSGRPRNVISKHFDPKIRKSFITKIEISRKLADKIYEILNHKSMMISKTNEILKDEEYRNLFFIP